MSILKNRLSHIQRRETKIRTDLGRSVTIRSEVRTKTASYDEFYGSSTTVGGGDGYATTYTDIEYLCNIFWITESDQENLSFGDLEVGNCVIYADISAKEDFKNAEKNKWRVTVDSEKMLATRIMPGDLLTEIAIHLVKQKEEDD